MVLLWQQKHMQDILQQLTIQRKTSDRPVQSNINSLMQKNKCFNNKMKWLKNVFIADH
jgi:hypothetical protein